MEEKTETKMDSSEKNPENDENSEPNSQTEENLKEANEEKSEESDEQENLIEDDKDNKASSGLEESKKKSVDLQSSDAEEEKTSELSNETDPQSNLIEENEEEPQKKENLKEMDLKDVLKINNASINFGDLFPGQILEETVIILNNLTATKVPFKIKINCLSQEFDELDEYVYSMRRPTTQDVFNYNDTFLILLAQKAISYYKLAIKVPNIKEEKEILGNIEITCTECKNGKIVIPIKSKISNQFYSI